MHEEMVSSEAGEVGRAQITAELAPQGKEAGFNAKHDGKPVGRGVT